MLTHLPRPSTRRHRAGMFGHDPDPVPAANGGEGGQPRRHATLLGHNTVVAVAMLLSAVLVGLATVALH